MSKDDRYDYARHRYIWDAMGKRVPLEVQLPSELPSIETIAHSLSQLCRWTGHTREFYSVAQHCVLVSFMVPEQWALEALLHDAAECLTGDISSPLKLELNSDRLREITAQFDMCLAARERLVYPPSAVPFVKKADELIARLEARDLLGISSDDLTRHFGIDCGARDIDERAMLACVPCVMPASAPIAKRWWLMRYKELARVAAAGVEDKC